jgi:hypothetical protein
VNRLLFVIALALPFAASAANPPYIQDNPKILAALLARAGNITVVDENGNKNGKSLAEILAAAFVTDVHVPARQTVNLTSGVSAVCMNANPSSPQDESVQCVLYVNRGKFVRTSQGLQGPSDEPTLMFRFSANLGPGGKLEVTGETVQLSNAP